MEVGVDEQCSCTQVVRNRHLVLSLLMRSLCRRAWCCSFFVRICCSNLEEETELLIRHWRLKGKFSAMTAMTLTLTPSQLSLSHYHAAAVQLDGSPVHKTKTSDYTADR